MAANEGTHGFIRGKLLRWAIVGFAVVVIGMGVNVMVLQRASRDTKHRQEQQAEQIAKLLSENGLDPEKARQVAVSTVQAMEHPDYRPQDITAATNATYIFAHRLSKQQYDSIYDDSWDGFKQAVSRDYFISLLKFIDEKTGGCGDVTLALTSARRDGDGKPYVQQKFTRKCRKIDELKEGVTWIMVDGNAKLRNYDVLTPELADMLKRNMPNMQQR